MAIIATSILSDGRHAPQRHGGHVSLLFWGMAAVLLVAIGIGLPLGKPVWIALGAVVFIGGGLPHGAYDIALLRRVAVLGRPVTVGVICGYIGVAAAMALLWSLLPLVALILFLVIACVHFGEDWEMLEEPLFRAAAGAAVIVAPVLGHTGDVTRLFVAMSDGRAVMVAQVLVAAAPVVLLIAAVSIVVAWQEKGRAWAAAMALCLALLVIAPPVLGFALFFVFLHSPRHLAMTRATLSDMTLGRWFATGALLSAATLIGWWLLQRLSLAPVSGNVAASAFQLLACVAVPHLLLSRWIERRVEHERRLEQARATGANG